MRADRGVHLHRHLGPCLAGQRDQPVDPRGPAARVALRHLPHADQRAAPAPQHQLLQVPGQRPVTLLHRLEDPAAQPPYLLLMAPPVHTAPRRHHQTGAGPQVRSPKCPTCPSVPAFTLASPQRLTCPRQRPCGPEHQARYPASYTSTFREETRPCGTRFPAAFQPPAFASWAPCPARDFRPSYDRPTAPPAHTRACTADPDEVYTFRTHETQTGPGAFSTPGTAVLTGHRVSAAVACRLSAAGPCHPGSATQPGMLV